MSPGIEFSPLQALADSQEIIPVDVVGELSDVSDVDDDFDEDDFDDEFDDDFEEEIEDEYEAENDEFPDDPFGNSPGFGQDEDVADEPDEDEDAE